MSETGERMDATDKAASATGAPPDMINHPPHYRGEGGIEAIDVIEAWGLDYHLGNAVKYILRADRKGKRDEDLKKARWYLRRWLESPTYGDIDEDDDVPSAETVAQAFGLDDNLTDALIFVERSRCDMALDDEFFVRETIKCLDRALGEAPDTAEG